MTLPPSWTPKRIAAALADAHRHQAAGQAHGSVTRCARMIVTQSRDTIFRSDKQADGERLARKFCGVIDALVTGLAMQTDAQDLAPIAIVATGGYGRGLLAPHSDIDLLFLHGGMREEKLRERINKILYPLWDAGLTVGQGVHTPASAIKLAREDLTAQTALLERRFITGQAKYFEDFEKRYDSLRIKSRSKFIKQKISEQHTRHLAHERARYLVEPDLKEAKGGLRDIDTIGWLYRYHTGTDLYTENPVSKLLRRDEIRSLRRARSILIGMRAGLHMLRGRADDRLTFDVQPALADMLGYADRPNALAPERLVRHFFVNGLEIGRLSRVFLARLDEEVNRQAKRVAKDLPPSLLADEAKGRVNIRLKADRLDFERPAKARQTPIDFFRLFRAFARQSTFDLHPDALSLISRHLPLITKEVRNDPEIAKIFMSTLINARDPAAILRLMSETGLLAKYIPLFGQITGRIEYGLFRRYSIEEQCFQAVGILSDLAHGRLKDEFPTTSAAARRLAHDPALIFAVLMHEAGLSLKEPSVERTERLLARVARRLGLEGDALETAVFVAARPLLLARQSERRNLSEIKTIEQFADAIGNAYTLDLMLILTVCRLAVLRGDSWTSRARNQTTFLYEATAVRLKGDDAALPRWLEKRARQTIADIGARSVLAKNLPMGLLAILEDAMIARADTLIDAAMKEGEGAAVSVTYEKGVLEALVYASDRIGLIADLAGAVAQTGASICALHAMTLDGTQVLDAFTLLLPEALARGERDTAQHAAFLAEVHQALLSSARARPHKPPKVTRRIGDRRKLFDVEPAIRLDLEGSDDCLILEADGRDRPGLLYSLASTLSDLGVMIRSAHIATYGERVVDVFYLADAPGYKIVNARRIQSIERRLLAVLRDERV